MAATSNNVVATVNIPRVRFFCAVFFLASSLVYSLSRVISGIELSALYRTAMFTAVFTELITLRMFLPVIWTSSVSLIIYKPPFLPFFLSLLLLEIGLHS